MSSCAITARAAWVKRSRSCGGVPAGASKKCSVSSATSGKPASLKVGTSGRLTQRVWVATASPRITPACTCACAPGNAVSSKSTVPVSSACVAGPPPLNGMLVMSTPALSLNSSIANCGVVPLPGARIIELARLGFGARDHIGQRFDTALGVHRENIRRDRKRGDGGKILRRIVSDVFVERRIDDERARREEKRIAVRFGARCLNHANIGAGAGAVFHDHGLAERLLQRRLQKPR